MMLDIPYPHLECWLRPPLYTSRHICIPLVWSSPSRVFQFSVLRQASKAQTTRGENEDMLITHLTHHTPYIMWGPRYCMRQRNRLSLALVYRL